MSIGANNVSLYRFSKFCNALYSDLKLTNLIFLNPNISDRQNITFKICHIGSSNYFLSRTNLFPNPSNSFSNLMVYSWLFIHSTTKAGAGDSYEGPPAVVVDDERPPTVPQA